jgi:hypothetical protein
MKAGRMTPRIRLGLLVLALSSCIGEIGGDGREGTVSEKLCEGVSPGPNYVRRLTAVQFRNTIADLFGASVDSGTSFPEATIDGGFRTNMNANVVTSAGAEGIEETAIHISQQLTADLGAFVGCDPAAEGDACVRAFVDRVGATVFRRPLLVEESDRLVALYPTILATEGATPRHGIEAIVQALLQSPQFLYLAEIAGEGAAPGEVVELSGYELAARLSYLLWDTTPDAELLQRAADGSLRDVLDAQARRLLADPRADAVLIGFFEDLTEIQKLASPKDPAVYPEWTPELAVAAHEELGAFVRWVVRESDGNLATLLTAPTTVVNATLAAHYGVAAPQGDEWQVTSLDPTQRAGFLTQPGFLAAHAYAASSSPIARGAFVRTQLLCQELAPPPNVMFEVPAVDPNVSTRERLAQHRTDPACAGCHALMDPIGFGLENFDAIGSWRDTEGNAIPIDATGELAAAGVAEPAFNGPIELAALLAGSDRVSACIALQFHRYAQGRSEEDGDAGAIADHRDAFALSGGNLVETLVAFVMTDSFRYRLATNSEGEP